MRVSVLTALAALSACSDPPVGSDSVDVNAAAARAQGDIDTYAADRRAAQRPAVAIAPPVVPAALPTSSATPTPSAQADGPAAVARAYIAAIAAGRYDRAYLLWDGAGRASGLDPKQFAASFSRYARITGQVGVPGRIDAGAGQRFTAVPVQLRGTLAADGSPFALEGTLILHRAAAIDGATSVQRSWRIREANLATAPTTLAQRSPTAGYRCAGATRVSARSEPRATDDKGSASERGIWYRRDQADASETAPTACMAGN